MREFRFRAGLFARAFAAVAFVGAAAAAETSATPFQPAVVETIAFQKASLKVVGPEGEKTYTPSDLEDFGVYRTVTTTPWRDEAATFEGVRLVDVLEANGLAEHSALRVVAENDYAVVLPQEVWRDHDILIVTRVNGKAHSRRERGPLQFIFSLEADPEMAAKRAEPYWVWMAQRIEPLE